MNINSLVLALGLFGCIQPAFGFGYTMSPGAAKRAKIGAGVGVCATAVTIWLGQYKKSLIQQRDHLNQCEELTAAQEQQLTDLTQRINVIKKIMGYGKTAAVMGFGYAALQWLGTQCGGCLDTMGRAIGEALQQRKAAGATCRAIRAGLIGQLTNLSTVDGFLTSVERNPLDSINKLLELDSFLKATGDAANATMDLADQFVQLTPVLDRADVVPVQILVQTIRRPDAERARRLRAIKGKLGALVGTALAADEAATIGVLNRNVDTLISFFDESAATFAQTAQV